MAFVGNQDFQGELNRLANGGTYPSRDQYLNAQGAANKWAGTTGLALLGALNAKAGNTGLARRGLNAVCNQLAGTTGWDAQAALQQVAGGAGGGTLFPNATLFPATTLYPAA